MASYVDGPFGRRTACVYSTSVAAQVFGWPLLPDGRRGRQCLATLQAVERFQRVCDVGHIPLVLWDERFSSADARDGMAAMGVRGKPRTAVNQLAAEVILQVRWVLASQCCSLSTMLREACCHSVARHSWMPSTSQPRTRVRLRRNRCHRATVRVQALRAHAT